MLSSLITAFRQQYPRGSLVSELLTIHDGQYVVRVMVGLEGETLSAGLGANSNLEMAEDIACTRALERLLPATPMGKDPGVNPSSATPVKAAPSLPKSSLPEPPLPEPEPSMPKTLTPSPKLTLVKNADSSPASSPPAPESSLEYSTAPKDSDLDPSSKILSKSPTVEAVAATPEPISPLADVAPAPLETSPLEAPQGVSKEPDIPSAGLNVMPTTPVDLSDIIAQTDVELQRLGWGVSQGREFLEKTYGKRSRHDLTDEELLEFLLYLEGQPSPSFPPA